MSKAAAWIMKVGESFFASVSQMELVHIVNNPRYIEIPGAPDYCCNIIVWNDNILPVIDFSCLINSTTNSTTCDVAAVIIYRDSNNEIQYGGINLANSPELEYVDNSQSCEFPAHTKALQTISLSCFKSKSGYEVPILDMNKIFTGISTEFFSMQR